jgi:hypothetical protein
VTIEPITTSIGDIIGMYVAYNDKCSRFIIYKNNDLVEHDMDELVHILGFVTNTASTQLPIGYPRFIAEKIIKHLNKQYYAHKNS